MRARSLALLASATLLPGVSCLPGGRLPSLQAPVTAGSASWSLAEAAAPPQDGPPRVIFSAPQGQDIDEPSPLFVFSRPMHAIGAPPDQPRAVATFDPPVEGRWHWVGSRTLQFSPRQGFALATDYRVSLASGLRSLDGQVVEAPLELRFTTRRLRMLEASLWGEESSSDMSISFSLPVDPEDVARTLEIRDEAGKVVPFVVRTQEPSTSIAVGPEKTWPLKQTLRVRVDRSLRPREGALPMVEDGVAQVHERQPVTVTNLDCANAREDGVCPEGADVQISLSEDLPLAVLRPLVRIEPPVAFSLKVESWHKTNVGSVFSLRARFRPEVSYKVIVRSSSVRRPGTPGLDEGAELSFGVAPPGPWVNVLARGQYLRPGWTKELQATASRAREVSFTVTPLSLDALLERALKEDEDRPRSESTSKTLRRTMTVDDKGFETIALGELFGAPGPVQIDAQAVGARGEITRVSQVIQRTELALSAHLAPQGSLVWVTRLSDGSPVADAAVEVHDFKGHHVVARTDAQGLAEVDTSSLVTSTSHRRWTRHSLLIMARSGDDWVTLEGRQRADAPTEALLFSDRDFYRPGETIYLKGIARQPSKKGLVAPAGREATLTYSFPGGGPISVKKTLSAWGTFDHAITLPEDVSLEDMRIEWMDGDERLTSRRVLVRKVRPLSYKLTAHLDRERYAPGDPFTCQGSAQYLYGGSLQGAHFTSSTTVRPVSLTIPDHPGFVVGNRSIRGASETPGSDQGKLPVDGLTRVSGTIPRAPWPMSVHCEVLVTDAGLEMSADESWSEVRPASIYPAVRDVSGMHEPGTTLRPSVVVVTESGERREGKVQFELREADDTTPPLARCEVTSKKEPSSCALRLPALPARALELHATVIDPQGRASTTTQTLHLEAPDPDRPAPVVAPPPRPRPARPAPVEPPPPPPVIATDAESYGTGDTARLKLAPRERFARGLVLIEREGVMSHQEMVPGVTEVKVPLGPHMAPGVTASLLTVRGVGNDIPRLNPSPLYEEAHTMVRVKTDEEARKLAVTITPSKTEAAPGDQLTVDVQVDDSRGQGATAEVTLYAVDEGLLLLSQYSMPDPTRYLSQSEYSLVEDATTLGSIGWLLSPTRGYLGGSHRTKPPSVRMGATSTNGPPGPRTDFTPTPLFLPTLVTDAQGHAQASFKLPDSLTSYRIMAVAVGHGDRFGQAESTVKSRLPVQIRPVAPLALRAGDRFEVAAVVANNTDEVLDATLSIAGEGLLLDASDRRTVSLARGESRRVAFPVATPRAGQGSLTFRLHSARGDDEVSLPLTIASPLALEAASVSGQTTGRVLEPLADLGAMRPDVGRLDVTVSTSALGGLAPGLEQLVEYPYGCTEQLTSRLVPLLSLRDLARALGVALPADVDQASQRAVEAILRNRRHGRFGLWYHSAPTPWVTAYAYGGLVEARRHGVWVDPAVLREGASVLGEMALDWGRSDEARAEASFALDVMSAIPELDPTQRAHALLVARQIAAAGGAPGRASGDALLLHALAALGESAEGTAPLVRALEGRVTLEGAQARVRGAGSFDFLDSPVRSSALTLRALLVAAPTHPLIEPLARGLVADRGPRGWRTTQETAWALRALDAYRRAREGEVRDVGVRVTAAGRTMLDARLEGLTAERRGSLSMAELLAMPGGGLLVEATGGPAYYEARLQYVPRSMPTEPIAAGFEVSRRCRLLGGSWDEQMPGEVSFPLGSWVGCEVTVSTALTRRFVALSDPVPSGFELVEPDVRNEVPSWARQFEQGRADKVERRPERMIYFIDQMRPGVHRFRYVARAITAGSFVQPPTRVEEMYTPEIFAQTPGGETLVRP